MRVQRYLVEDIANARLDVYLVGLVEEWSRSYIKKLIDHGLVLVNNKPVKASYNVKPGDYIEISIPEPVETTIKPENIKLDIYYEDDDLIVVNKPRGMVVHPAEGNYEGTLVNALLYHCSNLSGINGVQRPGIVHRLDKDTSGLLMVAKNDFIHVHLSRQLQERTVNRNYLCLVHGNLKEDTGKIDAPIGRDVKDRKKMAVTWRNAKEATTYYQVIKRFGDYTYLKLKLATGRTHQIRVHLSYINHPVVGDLKYGPSKPHFDLQGQFLHAAVLGFIHPRTKNYLEFKAPLPEELKYVLDRIVKH